MNIEKKILVLIFLIALLLRFTPIILFQSPVLYDYAYHERMANKIISLQDIPLIDESLNGRPYSYAPFYHLLLAFLSIVSGLSVKNILMFLLPFIASLFCLSLYVFLRKITTEFNALLGAFFAAIAPPLISASFDSPENIVFFSLPLILFLIFEKKNFFAAIFFSLNLFWNYFAFILSLPAFFLGFFKEKNLIKKTIICLAVSLILFIFLVNFSFSMQSVQSGTNFVANNLKNVMIPLIFNFAVIVLPLFFYAFNKLYNNYLKFWFSHALISFLAMLSYPLTVIFRPWEQPKFFALGSIVLFSSIKRNKLFELFFLIVLLLSSFLALSFSFQVIYPKVTNADLKALSFALQNAGDKKILAEPTLSEVIMNYSKDEKKVLTALYFEASNNDTANAALEFLGSKNLGGIENETIFFKQNNIGLVMLNFEDSFVRGTKEFNEKSYLNKIYSLSYNGTCFSFLSNSALCGNQETMIYAFNVT